MALKFQLDSLDSLDEGVSKLYTEKEGKFYLNVEGAVAKSTVDGFRDKNIDLMNQLKGFEGIDVKEYEKMLKKQDLDKGKKMMPASEIDIQVAERVKSMKTDFDTKNTELTKSNGVLTKQLEGLLIDSAVRSAAITAKVLPEAMDDVLLRAKSVFRIDEGVAIPYDGESVRYGKDGKSPLTVTEWIGTLNQAASHLFHASVGGGAHNRSGPGGKVDASKLNANQKIKAGLEAAS